MDVGERGGAVELGLARAEEIEVGAADDADAQGYESSFRRTGKRVRSM
jgi:hypothetical protein